MTNAILVVTAQDHNETVQKVDCGMKKQMITGLAELLLRNTDFEILEFKIKVICEYD